MDARYINPFINSMINTMEMMMGLTAEPQAPFIKGDNATQGDITGIIGFAEKNVTGSVALSFPKGAALKMFSALTGEVVSEITRDVEDSIGELANIVAGGAKTVLASEGLSFHISIPSVIVGPNHSITHKGRTPVIVVPFIVGEFKFVLEISMKFIDQE